MTWENLGLAWYCAVSLLTPLVLAWDWWLGRTDHTMITVFCRAHPWAAFLLLCLLLSAVAGLAIHFMSPKGHDLY